MTDIVTVVVGVILTALVAWRVSEYRSLITYELNSSYHYIGIEDGQLCPRNETSKTIQIHFHRIVLTNRGFKGVKNLRLHADGLFEPLSIKKDLMTISADSVVLSTTETSLQISIDYLPPNETVIVSFANKDFGPLFVKLVGANDGFKLVPHYSHTLRKGKADFWLLVIVIFAFVGSVILDQLIS